MVDFEWDEEKNRRNKKKHAVSFERARAVFEDRGAWDFLDDREEYGEDRWMTVGMVSAEFLAVVYTQREERIRIISARRATREEINGYLENRGGAGRNF